MKTRVVVVMGSKSDLAALEPGLTTLKDLGIPYDVRVLSAHRTPGEAAELADRADERYGVVIAAAGGAAHLAGAIAARTTLPVIGIPIPSSPLQGLDSLLSTVQMPPGIPVATVSIGEWGATNAAVLAAQILALGDAAIQKRLRAFKDAQAAKVLAADAEMKARSSPSPPPPSPSPPPP